MTKGIYKLTFPTLEDWPYIGCSQDIEARYSAHIASLNRGVSNYKLQDISNSYPILEVIEECEDFKEKESTYIARYNSIDHGLNLTSGGDSRGAGTKHARSKYSEEQILETFFMICDPKYTFKEISEKTGVGFGQVASISRGTTHLWLKELYPEKFNYMLSIKGFRAKYRSQTTGTLYHIDGSTLELTEDTPKFYPLFDGELNSVDGWSLYKPDIHYIVSPDKDVVYEVPDAKTAAFASYILVSRQAIRYMVYSINRTCKGFRLANKNQIKDLPHIKFREWSINVKKHN